MHQNAFVAVLCRGPSWVAYSAPTECLAGSRERREMRNGKGRIGKVVEGMENGTRNPAIAGMADRTDQIKNRHTFRNWTGSRPGSWTTVPQSINCELCKCC